MRIKKIKLCNFGSYEGENQFEIDTGCPDQRIVIVGGKNGVITDYAMPCGACRQVLAEFCNADFKVYVGINENDIIEFKLSELLPFSFNKSKLGD